MTLINANRITEKYGFPKNLEYDNPDWHGHSFGVALGLINPNTNEIIKNFVDIKDPEEQDKALLEIINSLSVRLLCRPIYTMNETTHKPEMHKLYYLPYMYPEHSKYKLTVIENTIDPANNSGHYDIEIEIILVNPDDTSYCRYAVFKTKTQNMSLMEIVKDVFETDMKSYPDVFTIADSGNISVRFYNQIGEHTDIEFPNGEAIYNIINSVRLIKCKFENK